MEKPAASKEEPTIDYSDPKVLDEQIKLAEQALQQLEMRCSAEINFSRGNLNALQRIKENKAIVSKMPVILKT